MTWHAKALNGIWYYVCGGMLFWLPDGLWHFLRGSRSSFIDVIVLTVVPAGAVVAGWRLLLSRTSDRSDRMFASVMMILGILTTAPLCTMVNFTFAGGGFASGATLQQVGILTLLFPLADIDCFTYDETLLAIAACLAGLLLLVIRYRNPQPLGPGQRPGSGPPLGMTPDGA